jgi:predicted nucleic acid-binding protein
MRLCGFCRGTGVNKEHVWPDWLRRIILDSRATVGQKESQVIAHRVGVSRWAVLDDRAARRCAIAYGIHVIGSLGVVLRSKKKSASRPHVP